MPNLQEERYMRSIEKLNTKLEERISELEQENQRLREFACWLRDNVHPNLLEHPYYQDNKSILEEGEDG